MLLIAIAPEDEYVVLKDDDAKPIFQRKMLGPHTKSQLIFQQVEG